MTIVSITPWIALNRDVSTTLGRAHPYTQAPNTLPFALRHGTAVVWFRSPIFLLITVSRNLKPFFFCVVLCSSAGLPPATFSAPQKNGIVTNANNQTRHPPIEKRAQHQPITETHRGRKPGRCALCILYLCKLHA